MASCVLHFIWNWFQIPRKHHRTLALPTNIIRAGEPGHKVRLAYYFASFRKELWVDRVQLLQLTKKKKNTKYLLERRGDMNDAVSGHYTSCQCYLKRDIVIIVGL